MAEKKNSKTILIAEDEIPLQKILSDKLRQIGYEVVTADDGEDAITKFDTNQVDIILLDLVMPIKSGFEVIEDVRLNKGSDVPIIILSNLSQDSDVEAATNLGANDFMVKSNIDLTELVAKIAKLISASQ